MFNGGLTAAQVDAARAVYWQSVANYRQTVLTAFQQVEDELAAIRFLSQQLAAERRAVADERKAVDVFLNQFQAGTVAFTTVVVAEVALLADEESELTARQNLFLASVSLIEALGGGWDTTLLPTQVQLEKGFSFLPETESPTPPALSNLHPQRQTRRTHCRPRRRTVADQLPPSGAESAALRLRLRTPGSMPPGVNCARA